MSVPRLYVGDAAMALEAGREVGLPDDAAHHAAKVLRLRAGDRVTLFTDLANPTSNAIYRRIGYEAVAEILGYDFA